MFLKNESNIVDYNVFESDSAFHVSTLNFLKMKTFLDLIDKHKLPIDSVNKFDISIVEYDFKTKQESVFGFSIKSLIGKDSTLFNAGAGTNFIYEIDLPNNTFFDVTEFNKSTYSNQSSKGESKIGNRIKGIESLGGSLKFHSIQSNILALNLSLIDGALPIILAEMLKYRFKTGINKISYLIDYLNKNNPLKFNLDLGHPFYKYKIKNFLTDCALGMTPEKVWIGEYDATGGIIYAKDNGDVVCYHIYNKKEFEEYLLNHTRLEQASTSEDENNPGKADPKSKPFKYGWIYGESDKFFIKLNLQIRFT